MTLWHQFAVIIKATGVSNILHHRRAREDVNTCWTFCKQLSNFLYPRNFSTKPETFELKDDKSGPLPVEQVSVKSYLPDKKSTAG